jgi:hypothetical protein
MSTPLNAQQHAGRQRFPARLCCAFFCRGTQVVKPSFVEQICNAYSDGLAAGLRNDSARPHQGIEELERAYALGLRDDAMMRERKQRLDAGVRVYQ